MRFQAPIHRIDAPCAPSFPSAKRSSISTITVFCASPRLAKLVTLLDSPPTASCSTCPICDKSSQVAYNPAERNARISSTKFCTAHSISLEAVVSATCTEAKALPSRAALSSQVVIIAPPVVAITQGSGKIKANPSARRLDAIATQWVRAVANSGIKRISTQSFSLASH